MENKEVEQLARVLTRIERKLDAVIRAIYEHDEDIQDEYGRSQRTLDARFTHTAGEAAGGILGYSDESSSEEPRAPVANRSSKGETNPPRDNGKVQREGSIPRSNQKNQNVPREDGVRKHATSKPNATNRGYRGRKGKRGSNGEVRGSNQGHNAGKVSDV